MKKEWTFFDGRHYTSNSIKIGFKDESGIEYVFVVSYDIHDLMTYLLNDSMGRDGSRETFTELYEGANFRKDIDSISLCSDYIDKEEYYVAYECEYRAKVKPEKINRTDKFFLSIPKEFYMFIERNFGKEFGKKFNKISFDAQKFRVCSNNRTISYGEGTGYSIHTFECFNKHSGVWMKRNISGFPYGKDEFANIIPFLDRPELFINRFKIMQKGKSKKIYDIKNDRYLEICETYLMKKYLNAYNRYIKKIMKSIGNCEQDFAKLEI